MIGKLLPFQKLKEIVTNFKRNRLNLVKIINKYRIVLIKFKKNRIFLKEKSSLLSRLIGNKKRVKIVAINIVKIIKI